MPFVAFDLQGTLCTFEKVIKAIEETQQEQNNNVAKDFFSFWYTLALRDYIGTSQAGKYCALIKILKFTLPRALLCFRDGLMRLNEIEMQDIMSSFDQIEPDSEAIEALDLLVLNKWDIWVLSVGNMERTEKLLERTELKKYLGDNILCCDDLNLSKPHPKVYSELMRLAVHRTQRIENFYLIGSHAFDLASAKNISLKTVFLNTTEKIYPSEIYNSNGPDITGTSLLECVEKMIEFERLQK